MSNDLLAQIRAKRQTFADAKNGSKGFYKFKPGTTLIRILPSWRDESASERPFYHDFGQSFIKDMDGNLITVIGDRRMTYGEDDPVRNLINLAMSEAPTDAQREHYRQMLAKQSYIVNVQVMNDSAVSPDEPQLVSFSRTQMDQILKLMEKLLLKGHNPLDLENGFDLEVDRTGTKVTDTRYSYNFERDSRKVNPDVMTRAIDLDSYVRTKFAESDRAINAIKSISQGALLPAPGKAVSLTNDTTPPWDDKIEDAEYSVVDDAKAGVREPISTNTVEVSQDEIDKLLAGL